MKKKYINFYSIQGEMTKDEFFQALIERNRKIIKKEEQGKIEDIKSWEHRWNNNWSFQRGPIIYGVIPNTQEENEKVILNCAIVLENKFNKSYSEQLEYV